MSHRCLAALFTVMAVVLLAPAGSAAPELGRAPDAMGRSRPAGELDEHDDHPAGAARRAGGTGRADRRGTGRPRRGRRRRPRAAGHRAGHRRDRLVQQLLGRAGRPDGAHVPDRRPAGRQAAAGAGRGGAPRRAGVVPQPRTGRAGRPQPLRALHLARDAGLDDARLLQPQLPDSADPGLCRDPRRDDPRRPHHSAGRAAPRRPANPASGWATRAGAGTATPWSSRPATSSR